MQCKEKVELNNLGTFMLKSTVYQGDSFTFSSTYILKIVAMSNRYLRIILD